MLRAWNEAHHTFEREIGHFRNLLKIRIKIVDFCVGILNDIRCWAVLKRNQVLLNACPQNRHVDILKQHAIQTMGKSCYGRIACSAWDCYRNEISINSCRSLSEHTRWRTTERGEIEPCNIVFLGKTRARRGGCCRRKEDAGLDFKPRREVRDGLG
jgi:hypothetical protein